MEQPTKTKVRTREPIVGRLPSEPVKISMGGGSEPPNNGGGCGGLVAAAGGLSFFGGIGFLISLPDGTLAPYLKQFGRWLYVAYCAACVIYFIWLLIRLPLKPDWIKHIELAKQAQKAFVLVMIIASVQLFISDWNTEHGMTLHLPSAVFASFVPLFIFASYAIVVQCLSPVKKTIGGVTYRTKVSPNSMPALRYVLTLTFSVGALLSALLALHRIISVFRAFPVGWYESYLPWKWFQ